MKFKSALSLALATAVSAHGHGHGDIDPDTPDNYIAQHVSRYTPMRYLSTNESRWHQNITWVKIYTAMIILTIIQDQWIRFGCVALHHSWFIIHSRSNQFPSSNYMIWIETIFSLAQRLKPFTVCIITNPLATQNQIKSTLIR